MDVDAEAVDIRFLGAPPNLPSPFYEPTPTCDDGEIAWNEIHARVVALEALASELRALLERSPRRPRRAG